MSIAIIVRDLICHLKERAGADHQRVLRVNLGTDDPVRTARPCSRAFDVRGFRCDAARARRRPRRHPANPGAARRMIQRNPCVVIREDFVTASLWACAVPRRRSSYVI